MANSRKPKKLSERKKTDGPGCSSAAAKKQLPDKKQDGNIPSSDLKGPQDRLQKTASADTPVPVRGAKKSIGKYRAVNSRGTQRSADGRQMGSRKPPSSVRSGIVRDEFSDGEGSAAGPQPVSVPVTAEDMPEHEQVPVQRRAAEKTKQHNPDARPVVPAKGQGRQSENSAQAKPVFKEKGAQVAKAFAFRRSGVSSSNRLRLQQPRQSAGKMQQERPVPSSLRPRAGGAPSAKNICFSRRGFTVRQTLKRKCTVQAQQIVKPEICTDTFHPLPVEVAVRPVAVFAGMPSRKQQYTNRMQRFRIMRSGSHKPEISAGSDSFVRGQVNPQNAPAVPAARGTAQRPGAAKCTPDWARFCMAKGAAKLVADENRMLPLAEKSRVVQDGKGRSSILLQQKEIPRICRPHHHLRRKTVPIRRQWKLRLIRSCRSAEKRFRKRGIPAAASKTGQRPDTRSFLPRFRQEAARAAVRLQDRRQKQDKEKEKTLQIRKSSTAAVWEAAVSAAFREETIADSKRRTHKRPPASGKRKQRRLLLLRRYSPGKDRRFRGAKSTRADRNPTEHDGHPALLRQEKVRAPKTGKSAAGIQQAVPETVASDEAGSPEAKAEKELEAGVRKTADAAEAAIQKTAALMQRRKRTGKTSRVPHGPAAKAKRNARSDHCGTRGKPRRQARRLIPRKTKDILTARQAARQSVFSGYGAACAEKAAFARDHITAGRKAGSLFAAVRPTIMTSNPLGWFTGIAITVVAAAVIFAVLIISTGHIGFVEGGMGGITEVNVRETEQMHYEFLRRWRHEYLEPDVAAWQGQDHVIVHIAVGDEIYNTTEVPALEDNFDDAAAIFIMRHNREMAFGEESRDEAWEIFCTINGIATEMAPWVSAEGDQYTVVTIRIANLRVPQTEIGMLFGFTQEELQEMQEWIHPPGEKAYWWARLLGRDTSFWERENMNFSSMFLGIPSSEATYRLLQECQKMLGLGYSQGARYSDSFCDCSSFVHRAYRNAFDFNFDGSAWQNTDSLLRWCEAQGITGECSAGTYMDLLEPGDLIFWTGRSNGYYQGVWHVAIYAGGGKMWESAPSSDGVVYRDVAVQSVSRITHYARPLSLITYTGSALPENMHQAVLTGGREVTVPSSIAQTGICGDATPFNRQNWAYDMGRIQRLWRSAGSTASGHLCTLNGYYLVACTTTFGQTGDLLTIRLDNGKTITAIQTDAKSPADSNWTPYGHYLGGSAVSVVEWETTYAGAQNGSPVNTAQLKSELEALGFYGAKVVSIINHGRWLK